MNEKRPQSSPSIVGRRVSAVIARSRAIPTRVRLVTWLLMSLLAFWLGLPLLFSAALIGLPWLLLPPCQRRGDEK